MYRIQAHNMRTKGIDVFIVVDMVQRMQKIKQLETSGDYGLIEWEYNPRGYFYR